MASHAKDTIVNGVGQCKCTHGFCHPTYKSLYNPRAIPLLRVAGYALLNPMTGELVIVKLLPLWMDTYKIILIT